MKMKSTNAYIFLILISSLIDIIKQKQKHSLFKTINLLNMLSFT